MDLRTFSALAGLALTVGVGFWKIASTLARIDLKLDLMWDAYLKGQAPSFNRRVPNHDRRAPTTDDPVDHP